MVRIRKAVPQDALGITIVNVYTWKTTYAGLMPEDMIDSRIAGLRKRVERCRDDIERDDNFLVAAADETVVGFCIYGKSRNYDFKNCGEIFALYVLKGFQGTGLGKVLFSAGIKALLKQGMTSMILNCLRGNPSLGFYKHMGGKIVGQRTDESQDGKIMEDIVLYENLTRFSPAKSGATRT